jgi:ubiquinone/menaquinone biosynthesis C-methylase UbiE
VEDTASQYFGAMVEEYDSLLRRAVPRYDEMIARTVEYMPAGRTRILELGCGTGNFTLAVASRFPDAHLTLVDGAREMLDCASARLGDRPVECVEARFEELDLPAGSFDLVTSCISLHHVEDMAGLFRRLHGFLAPGGALVYADQMRGRTEASHALNWGRMVDFWELPGHLDGEERQSLVDHAEAHDHYRDVISQLRWLEAAGFHELDCVWRNWMWGVLTARA